MASSYRRTLYLVAGVLLSVGFLYLSVRDVNIDDALTEIWKVPVIAVLLDPLSRLAAYGMAAVRSRLLFAPVHRFGMVRLFESVWLAAAINNVIPLRAGEVARIGFLARYGNLPASTCLAAVVVERVLDLLVLALIVSAAVPFMAGDLPLGTSFYAIVAVVVAAFAGVLVISRRPDWFQRVCVACARPFGARVRAYVKDKSETFAHGLSALGSASAVLGVMAATCGFWALSLAAIQLWIWALSLTVPWYAPAVVLGFLAFGLAIPSTPGHLGTFHFFASSSVIFMGVPDTQAVSFAVVFHAVAVVPLTVLGLPLLFREYSRLQRPRAPDSEPAPEPASEPE